MIERRRFPRIKDNVFVLIQSIEDEMLSFEAIIKDINQTGLMFRTSNFISEDSELRLEICQLLSYDKDTFFSMPAKAQIVWIKKVEENDEYLVGAKITKMNAENQNRLINYINNRLELK